MSRTQQMMRDLGNRWVINGSVARQMRLVSNTTWPVGPGVGVVGRDDRPEQALAMLRR